MIESLSSVEITTKRDKILVWVLALMVIVGQQAIGHSDTTLAPSIIVQNMPKVNYCLTILAFFLINWGQKLTVNVMGKLFLASTLFVLSMVDLFPGNSGSGFLLFLMMVCFAFCEDKVLLRAMVICRYYLVFIAAFGILTCLDFFVLHIIPHTVVPYYAGEGLSFYVNYFISYILWQGGTSFRLCGSFNEPGIFGVTLALMLVMDKINLRKWSNIILLIACCLTFSMACFIILIIGACLYSIKNVKFMLATIVIVLIGGAIISQSENKDVQYLVSRFEYDAREGKFRGDNRTGAGFLKAEQEFKDSGKELFGMGDGYLASKGLSDYSSYKSVYVEFGYVGFFLTTVCFLIFSLLTTKGNKNALIYWLCAGLTIYSRNNPYGVNELFYMYAGILAVLWCEAQQSADG